MGNKLYFWMLLMIFLSLGLLIHIDKANAMVASEIEPGTVELSTTNVYGFEIKEVVSRKVKSKEWVYFCLKEKVAKNPLFKCFYGLKQDFGDVKTGLVLNGIQYGLRNRIYDSKGKIDADRNAYYYPAKILRPQS